MCKYISKNTTFVLDEIKKARIEVLAKGKKIKADDSEIMDAVKDKIYGQSTLSDNYEHAKGNLVELIHSEVWKFAITEEACYIINKLKSGDEEFARDFFYGTNTSKCNICRFRSKIIAQIKSTYGECVSVEDFGNMLYIHLWDNGTWSVLDKYSYKSSIFSWLEQVAKHELMRYLRKTNRITVSSERTAENTRLLGTSVDTDTWSLIINEVMPKGLYHDLLIAKFVEQISEPLIIKKFGIKREMYSRVVSKAENSLRRKLLNTNSGFEQIVVRDRESHCVMVSDDFINDFSQWQNSRIESSCLSDVFGVNITGEDYHNKVVDFLMNFPKKLEWNDRDRLLWKLRFIENTPPVKVAEILGKKRSWVDTRYSRLNARFNTAVRKWWKENAI